MRYKRIPCPKHLGSRWPLISFLSLVYILVPFCFLSNPVGVLFSNSLTTVVFVFFSYPIIHFVFTQWEKTKRHLSRFPLLWLLCVKNFSRVFIVLFALYIIYLSLFLRLVFVVTLLNKINDEARCQNWLQHHLWFLCLPKGPRFSVYST